MLNDADTAAGQLPGDAQPAHFDGKRFHNARPRQQPGLAGFSRIMWDFFFNKPADTVPERALPVQPITAQALADAAAHSVFRLGHSSLLLKLSGRYWLVDPVFAERASPFRWLGPKRFQPAPIALSALPPLEGVILTHDHYDHLDRHALLQLNERVNHIITPLGVGDLLVKWGIAAAKITQLAWWQAQDIAGIRFVCTPTQHFSGRGLFDGNKRLWCSWTLLMPGLKLFLGGDSGYFDGFKTIGRRFGPFDAVFLENGAYDPRWADIHMLPADTLQASVDLNARWLFPIHNATFDLAFHRWDDPLQQIVRLAAARNVALCLPMLGQGIDLLQPQTQPDWWSAPELTTRGSGDPAG